MSEALYRGQSPFGFGLWRRDDRGRWTFSMPVEGATWRRVEAPDIADLVQLDDVCQATVVPEIEVFVVVGPDGLYGVYATQALAEQHRALMSRPDAFADEFDVERDVLRTELMPEVVE